MGTVEPDPVASAGDRPSTLCTHIGGHKASLRCQPVPTGTHSSPLNWCVHWMVIVALTVWRAATCLEVQGTVEKTFQQNLESEWMVMSVLAGAV